VTPEYAEKVGADVIIAALGAQPLKLPIPGIDGPNVFSAQDAYTALDQIGENVVILGAGLVGVELGLHLIKNGKKVTNIEMLDHISDGGNFLHILGLKVEIKKRGLAIEFNTKAKEIKSGRRAGRNRRRGKNSFRRIPSFMPSGRNRCIMKLRLLNFCAPEFYQIGACRFLQKYHQRQCGKRGFMIARNIGRFLRICRRLSAKPMPMAPGVGIILSASYFSSVMVVSLSVMLWTAWAINLFFQFLAQAELVAVNRAPSLMKSFLRRQTLRVFQSHCFEFGSIRLPQGS
jgi:hypothetical protein